MPSLEDRKCTGVNHPDGAYMACSGDGGWGYVIRDDACTVVSAGAGRCEYLLDALHAELLACLEGVRAAGEKDISKVVIQGKKASAKW